MGFGGYSSRCFFGSIGSRVPLFLPPPRDQRPAGPPLLAAAGSAAGPRGALADSEGGGG